MIFGEPFPCSADTANGFMVKQVKKTPPCGIGLTICEKFDKESYEIWMFNLWETIQNEFSAILRKTEIQSCISFDHTTNAILTPCHYSADNEQLTHNSCLMPIT